MSRRPKYAPLWWWLAPHVSKGFVLQLASLLKEYSNQQRVYAVEHNYYHIICIFSAELRARGSELSEIRCHYHMTRWQVSWNLPRDLNCNFSIIAGVAVSECIWLLASFLYFYVFQFKCFEGCKACWHSSLFLNESFLDLTSADTDILCKNEIKHKYSGEHLKDENTCNSLIGEPNWFRIKPWKDNTACKDDLIIIVISKKL